MRERKTSDRARTPSRRSQRQRGRALEQLGEVVRADYDALPRQRGEVEPGVAGERPPAGSDPLALRLVERFASVPVRQRQQKRERIGGGWLDGDVEPVQQVVVTPQVLGEYWLSKELT